MGKALYRKYRSRNFDEVIGQEHITKTLQHAIKSGKISHAYLFTGPKGVGKTSVARILAHEVNGLAYDDDSMHLDIIEIDAASNRRIDEIRELRDKVHVTPAVAKYKVYIIDEVHMLTREAFNALLKTLEEPPAHAIFILATTEAHKLPETIVSRTQRYTFKPVSTDEVAKHLGEIAKTEKIKITDDALRLLAQHGQGSFRDSISLLDQLGNSSQEITVDLVRKSLGLPPGSAVQELAAQIAAGQPAELLKSLENLFNQGMDAAAIAKELGNQLRTVLINGQRNSWTIGLLRELLNVSTSASPKDSLEIALLEAAAMNSSIDTTSSSLKTPRVLPLQAPPVVLTSLRERVLPNAPPAVVLKSELVVASVNQQFDLTLWPQVLDYAKKNATALYGALRLAKPAFSNGVLTIYFEFPLHQKKVNTAAQKDLIGQIIEELFGTKLKIDCVVDKEMFKKSLSPKKTVVKPLKKSENSSPQNNVSSIFGDVEVLE